MPTVNNTAVSDCICTFAEALGPAKATVIAFIDSLLIILQAFKMLEQLSSFSLEDYARKATLELALACQKAAVAEIAMGVNTIVGFGSRFSDCPPVGQFMRKVKQSRDELLGPLYEQEFEIQNYIAAIDDKAKKVQTIQKVIDWYQTLKDAIEVCGE